MVKGNDVEKVSHGDHRDEQRLVVDDGQRSSDKLCKARKGLETLEEIRFRTAIRNDLLFSSRLPSGMVILLPSLATMGRGHERREYRRLKLVYYWTHR